MIFNKFEESDVVEGRTTKVTSGFWPGGVTEWSSSYFENNFLELTTDETPSVAFGASKFDIRKTMYYIDVYPDLDSKNNTKDPYFSITYGHFAGSGSFDVETGSIKAFPTKAIYTQYKNLLLGTADLDGKFTFKSGSTEISADDVFIINFSTYKMKDRIDEGVFEISLQGPYVGQQVTFIDESHYTGNVSSVYQLVSGSLDAVPTEKPAYPGIGLLYPNDGIVVFNAKKLAELISLDDMFIAQQPLWPVIQSDLTTLSDQPVASYYSGSKGIGTDAQYVMATNDSRWTVFKSVDLGNQNNIMAFFWALRHSGKNVTVRKTEYVPARHYFIRVKNRDFNYSNNPTYVYDGTEVTSAGDQPTAGTIRVNEFFTDPKTYITTIGLYNNSNELVAVAKLSRPAVKSFDNELLVKIRLDM